MRGLTNGALDDAPQGFFADRSGIAILNSNEPRLVTFPTGARLSEQSVTTDATKRLVFLKDRLAKYEPGRVLYRTWYGLLSLTA